MPRGRLLPRSLGARRWWMRLFLLAVVLWRAEPMADGEAPSASLLNKPGMRLDAAALVRSWRHGDAQARGSAGSGCIGNEVWLARVASPSAVLRWLEPKVEALVSLEPPLNQLGGAQHRLAPPDPSYHGGGWNWESAGSSAPDLVNEAANKFWVRGATLPLLAGRGGVGERWDGAKQSAAPLFLASRGGEGGRRAVGMLCSDLRENVMFASGYFQQEARILSCIFRNHQLYVNPWNQGTINMIHTYILSVKGRTTDSLATTIGEVLNAESNSYLHYSYMALVQIVGSALYAIEQGLFSRFRCTRLSWFDDMHGVGTVPVVRVDPSTVDDSTAVEVPQIQQRGPRV